MDNTREEGQLTVQMSSLIEQVNSILSQYNISDGQLSERLGKKYAKNTIANFRHGKSTNPNLETFVDICNAAGIKIRLETGVSESAKLSDSVEEFRIINESLRQANEVLKAENLSLNNQISELTGTVDRVTKTNASLSDSLLKSVTRFDKIAEKYGLY